IDVSADCRLDRLEDAFGNITHAFTAEGPFDDLTVTVEGTVETADTSGVVRDAIERFPPSLYLRETPLSHADDAILAMARGLRAPDTLATLHALLARLRADIAFDTDPTHPGTTAAEAYALKRGVCQDITHIFIAAARGLDIPARYI